MHIIRFILKKSEKKIEESKAASEEDCTKILIATYKNDAGIIGAANIV